LKKIELKCHEAANVARWPFNLEEITRRRLRKRKPAEPVFLPPKGRVYFLQMQQQGNHFNDLNHSTTKNEIKWRNVGHGVMSFAGYFSALPFDFRNEIIFYGISTIDSTLSLNFIELKQLAEFISNFQLNASMQFVGNDGPLVN
jgi:hypothetical protein